MPAKKVVTREMIIDAAFEIVRAEGIDALNMRSLAQKCNCSTQPIYLSFRSAEELKTEVLKLAVKKYNKYLQSRMDVKYENDYKAVGMGYIRFAREDKELFKWLFMQPRSAELDKIEHSFGKTVKLIQSSFSVSENTAERIQTEMWIFVHGIATLYATGFIDWSWEQVGSLLTDAFLGIYSKLTGERK